MCVRSCHHQTARYSFCLRAPLCACTFLVYCCVKFSSGGLHYINQTALSSTPAPYAQNGGRMRLFASFALKCLRVIAPMPLAAPHRVNGVRDAKWQNGFSECDGASWLADARVLLFRITFDIRHSPTQLNSASRNFIWFFSAEVFHLKSETNCRVTCALPCSRTEYLIHSWVSVRVT